MTHQTNSQNPVTEAIIAIFEILFHGEQPISKMLDDTPPDIQLVDLMQALHTMLDEGYLTRRQENGRYRYRLTLHGIRTIERAIHPNVCPDCHYIFDEGEEPEESGFCYECHHTPVCGSCCGSKIIEDYYGFPIPCPHCCPEEHKAHRQEEEDRELYRHYRFMFS